MLSSCLITHYRIPFYSRFFKCQSSAAPQGTRGELRPHGPNSRPPLDPTEHSALRGRSEKRHAGWARIRGGLYKFSYDIAYSDAGFVSEGAAAVRVGFIFMGIGKSIKKFAP